MRRVSAEKPWALAVLLIVVVDLITTISGAQTREEIAAVPFVPIENPWIYLVLFYPLGLAMSFIVWLAGSGLVLGLARLFGGKGTYADTLLVFAFAQAPFLLLIFLDPLALLRVGLDLTGGVSQAISGGIQVAVVGLFVWFFVLVLMGLKNAHGFTYGRAALSACLPPCGCLLLAVGAIIVGVVLGGSALLSTFPF